MQGLFKALTPKKIEGPQGAPVITSEAPLNPSPETPSSGEGKPLYRALVAQNDVSTSPGPKLDPDKVKKFIKGFNG